MCVHVFAYVYVCECACVCVHVFAYVCVCECACVYTYTYIYIGFPCGSVVNNLPASAGDAGLLLVQEDAMEEEIATHSSILTWEIPWTEEPDGL